MAKEEILSADQKVTIVLDGDNADISAGGNGQLGNIVLKDAAGIQQIGINAMTTGGFISLSDKTGKAGVFLGNARLNVGSTGQSGKILLIPASATGVAPAVHWSISLDADSAHLMFRKDDNVRIHLDGINANAWLGGNGANGDLVLFASGGDNATPAKATIHLDGANGNIRLGGPALPGQAGVAGNLALFPDTAKETEVGDFSKASIHLNGQTGDIILQNADCAEEFDISESEQIEPGSVMVLDRTGTLRQCTDPYDRKVAGVISGAGNFKPGLLLDKKARHKNHRLPVAMLGKVYCKADANFAPIEMGDLLTTSPTPGHAMKAADPARAFGAVIGKALSPLSSGLGLIPILVNLQ